MLYALNLTVNGARQARDNQAAYGGTGKTKFRERRDTVNKLGERIVSEERPALRKPVEKMEESVMDNAANIRDAIAGIPYVTEDFLIAMFKPALTMAHHMEKGEWMK